MVAATGATQAMMAFAGMTLASIAPVVAADLGVPTAIVGYQVALTFGSGIATSLYAGRLIRRWGGCRTTQISLVVGAVGCALSAIASVPVIAVASMVIGLAYGLTNPSASHLLDRVAEARRRNLVFSIKQAVVPLGGVLAGLVAPPLALAFGWQVVPLAVGGVLLALAAGLQGPRAAWDDDRTPGGDASASPLFALRLVFGLAEVRWLTLAGALYIIVMLSLTGYLVTLLVEELGFSLVAAGLVLSTVQLGAVAARLGWGWLADRLGDGLRVLRWIGLISAAAATATTAMNAGWPHLAVQAVLLVFGVAALGWAGVFYGELAKVSPRGHVGTVTGGALAVSYVGTLVGPSLFALAHGRIGSYAATFGLVAVVAALGTACVLLAQRATRSSGPTAGAD